MRDFLRKILESPKNKIIFCVAIGIPIWALMTFVDFTPDAVIEAMPDVESTIEEIITDASPVEW